jgi:hypothetical protein
MAFGGGIFVTQNKVLPGSYINFVSADKATAFLGDRGIAALPLAMSWGKSGEVFLVENAEFIRDSKAIFGYEYTHDALKSVREVFKYAQKVYFYRLNNGGTAASGTFCTAKYVGIRGNDIKIGVSANVDDSDKWDVKTYLGVELVDYQTVVEFSDLVDNDFVVWNTEGTLEAQVATALTGGMDGETITGSQWQNALAALESVSFNVLGIYSDDDSVKALAVAYTKRLRDEMGVKFQTVVFNYDADEKGIINVVNSVDLVPWVTGAEAGCSVNKSVSNKVYDGECTVPTAYTQTQLEKALKSGQFIFHRVGEEVRVLSDINSKVTVTLEEGEDFKSNQTIRVLDQIANDVAYLFNTKYLGIVPNDSAGRTSLWNDIVKHHEELQVIRAIEGFLPEHVTIAQGNTKKDVAVNSQVQPTNCMEKLYMIVTVI